MKDVEIGMITAPLGIRGEVKVKSYAEDPGRFSRIKTIGLSMKDKGMVDYEIEHARTSGGMVVLKLAGVDDRNAAELLRHTQVFMDSDDLEPLAEGEHYIRDLLGLTVKNADTGEELGKLADVLTDRPQDIYVVKKVDGGEFMIPAVPEFISRISEEDGIIEVRLIDGLM